MYIVNPMYLVSLKFSGKCLVLKAYQVDNIISKELYDKLIGNVEGCKVQYLITYCL